MGTGLTLGSGNGTGIGFGIELMSSGKILVSGYFSKYNLTERGGIVRLNNDGSVDTEFNSNPGFLGSANEVRINPLNGKIYVAHGGDDYQGEVLFNSHTDFSGHNMHVIRLNGSGAEITSTIPELERLNNVQLYPNPANEKFTLTCTGTVNSSFNSIKIYDLQGREKWVSNMDGTITEISTKGLSPGIYIVKVENNTDHIIKRLVIK